uniref:Transcriptional regulator VspR n=1 Tax=Aliivibrio wodanis TaxID=80852 RepID=A0A5Q4YZD9_9GAMM|nr:transcriptional regulator VspR [synthetic construct]VVV03653.1 Transcriptional regulator VspR [Aliivibrio wodanis]
MSNKVKLNEVVFKILIENKLDGFTVSDMRDSVLEVSDLFESKEAAGTFAYRQIFALEKKKLLAKSEKVDGKKLTYYQTELLLNSQVTMKSYEFKERAKRTSVIPKASISSKEKPISELLKAVTKQKTQYEAELTMVLSETEEVKHVMSSFPDESTHLQALYLDLRNQSATLCGKVNALTKIIQLDEGKV